MATIGRIGVSAADGGDGLVLPDPFEVQQQGRDVTMSGYYVAASAAEAVWVRDQLLGLDPANNDAETVVPLTFASAAADVDGYYQPVGVQATLGRGSLGSGGTLRVDWSGVFRRGIDYKLPRIEVTAVTAAMTNDFAFGTPSYVVGVPNESTFYGVGGATFSTRATEHGTAALLAPTGGATSILPFSVSPASFYRSSAKIEYSLSGTYRAAVGRRDFAVHSSVRINNGLVRASINSTTLTVEWWDGAAWGTTSTYDLLWSADASVVTWKDATVLKNAPDECIMRLYGLSANLAGKGVTVDLALSRGQRVLRVYCAGWSSAIYGWRLGHTAAVAQTSTGYGSRRTAALSGNYTTLASNNAETRDLVNGRLTNSSTLGPYTAYGIGASIGTTTSSTPDGSDTVGAEFYGIAATSQRIVIG